MTSFSSQGNGIELSKVIPVSRYGNRVKYVTSITAGLVYELLESEKIRVDYDYQRGVKITRGKDGSEKRTPMVDSARVEDMARKILSDELYGGALARIHRWTGMDGVRTLEVGRGSNRRGWSGLEFG